MNCASNVNSSYYLRPTLMTCLQSKKKFDLVPTFTQIDNIYFIFYHLKLTSTLLCSRMYFFPRNFDICSAFSFRNAFEIKIAVLVHIIILLEFTLSIIPILLLSMIKLYVVQSSKIA